MGHCIDETVVLLTSTQLSDQKNRIYNHTRDDQGKEHDPEKQQNAFPPIQQDPSNIQSDRKGYQADAQAQEKYDRSAAARNSHGVGLILPRRLRDHCLAEHSHFCNRCHCIDRINPY